MKDSMNLSILLGYLGLQFLLCLYIAKRIQSQDDYLVAGRSLPLAMVSISLFATWFGAETCIGSSAAVYTDGISGSRADPFGYGLCLLFSGLLIAPRMWNEKYTTLADLYHFRFGKKSEYLATWILSLSSLIWAAAQLRAFSQVVSATTDLPVQSTLILSFGFVVAYTVLGGLLGDVITDVVQGAVISIGLIALFFVAWSAEPAIFENLLHQPAERLSFLGQTETWLERIDRWSIPILGSLVAQEIVSRILSAKSAKVAVKACYLSAIIYVALGSIPVILGLVGPELLKVDGDSEQFLIQLAQKYLPSWMVAIFAGALISALLATIDSILLSVSALVSHNVIIPAMKIENESTKLKLSRWVVVAAGFVAYIMAVYADSIYELLESASAFGTSGILIITIAGLWLKWGDDFTAAGTLLVGLAATPIAEYVFEAQSPFLVSVSCAFIAFCLLSIWTLKRRPRLS